MGDEVAAGVLIGLLVWTLWHDVSIYTTFRYRCTPTGALSAPLSR